MRLKPLLRAAALSAAALLALAAPAQTSAASGAAPSYGPLPPHNPYAGPDGTATMHGDTGSSDATSLPGPGPGELTSHRTALASACPTVLAGSDGYLVTLCTTIFGQVPTVHLLDPESGDSLAELPLTKGTLLGGVYAYLDHRDRLVVIDGTRTLLRIAHRRTAAGDWQLSVDSSLPLATAIPDGDGSVGIAPDWQGRVWFATAGGVVGTADDRTGTVRTLALPAGEKTANSISTAPGGTAVATTHALYLLTADPDGTPRTLWRQAYDRGPGRKPGQLSWGTGSTPVFFGPRTGTDYLAIVDNAAPTADLLVYRADSGERVCSVPVLKAGGSGSENAPIGAGNAVFIAGTYGYPYPKLPADAGPSVPASGGGFRGGLSRVDVRPDGSGCDLAWDVRARSSAVPFLSTADGLIHTVLREPLIPGTGTTTLLDPYDYAEIDPETGTVVRAHRLGIGALYDTLQMAGTIAPGGVVFQGTVTGVVRVAAG
ncbi:hypothetical protein ACIRD3_09315 [Kitasatospora sp. NPDC093550]|uniref:hypothetical protein n=1 Tax=Kitasatospora sp. NPDC093550 TaxID=3364089 RepID=UPI00380CA0E0